MIVYWSYDAQREEYHRTSWIQWAKDTVSAIWKTRWDRFFHVIR